MLITLRQEVTVIATVALSHPSASFFSLLRFTLDKPDLILCAEQLSGTAVPPLPGAGSCSRSVADGALAELWPAASREQSPTLWVQRSYKHTAFAGASLFLTRISDAIRATFQIVLCRIAAWLLIPSSAFVRLISFCVRKLLLGAFAESPLTDLWGDLSDPIGTSPNSVSGVHPDLCCGDVGIWGWVHGCNRVLCPPGSGRTAPFRMVLAA